MSGGRETSERYRDSHACRSLRHSSSGSQAPVSGFKSVHAAVFLQESSGVFMGRRRWTTLESCGSGAMTGRSTCQPLIAPCPNPLHSAHAVFFEVACCIAHGCARSITKFLDTEIDRSLVRLHVPPPGLSMSALMGRSSCPLHACKPYQACSLLQRIVVTMA